MKRKRIVKVAVTRPLKHAGAAVFLLGLSVFFGCFALIKFDQMGRAGDQIEINARTFQPSTTSFSGFIYAMMAVLMLAAATVEAIRWFRVRRSRSVAER